MLCRRYGVCLQIDGDIMHWQFSLETNHETPFGILTGRQTNLFFFHFAIPRIQEDDFYTIIVQRFGRPNIHEASGVWGSCPETWWNSVVRISLPRFGR